MIDPKLSFQDHAKLLVDKTKAKSNLLRYLARKHESVSTSTLTLIYKTLLQPGLRGSNSNLRIDQSQEGTSLHPVQYPLQHHAPALWHELNRRNIQSDQSKEDCIPTSFSGRPYILARRTTTKSKRNFSSTTSITTETVNQQNNQTGNPSISSRPKPLVKLLTTIRWNSETLPSLHELSQSFSFVFYFDKTLVLTQFITRRFFKYSIF